MTRLTFEKDDQGLRIALTGVVPTLQPPTEGQTDYRLCFHLNGDRVTAELTPAMLQTLGLQCVALMPEVGPQYAVASLEEAHRLPARALAHLDDRAIQVLLRECYCDSLIDFFWYMKDKALMKSFLRNMSQRAAEMLVEDIDEKWRGKNPDTAVLDYARRGREAVADILAIARRLIEEGQLPDVLGVRAAPRTGDAA